MALDWIRQEIGAYAIVVYYSNCTTIRHDSSGNGNDYISGAKTSNTPVQMCTEANPTTLWFKHDGGAGVYLE